MDQTNAILAPLDYVFFFGSLLLVMGLGLWAGRRESSTEDYYLAGKTSRWWGVAGSIFGSNVSANHIVGMMGLGFAVGFAQSQFEITAIAGLLLLCYGFLPVYRRLNVFTLSEYLSRRYDDQSRVLYALIMITIMVVIQMVPGFYFGSRSVNVLLQGGVGDIDPTGYRIGIIVMAVVIGLYTIIGGLKAVIMTDVIQSALLLVGALVVAFLVFSQPEIGGWGQMIRMDAAADGAGKMHLYEPSNHPNLPWTGMLSGLMILHFYYWGTNQFIVQRALAARSDREARFGIIIAGFFKLLIPFFSIGTGIAAFYLFKARGMEVASDAVFPTLMTSLVAPVGFGLVGLVAAGLIGAILSSLDSMMNSSATIVTFDIYRRYINPEASDQRLIWFGRIWIAIFIVGAALITIVFMDPNSEDSFFLYVAKHQSRLIAGVVVAFAVGMLWRRATAPGAVAAILVGIGLSYGLPPLYAMTLGHSPAVVAVFGETLNFFHAVFLAALAALAAHIAVSLLTQPDPEKGKLTWTQLGGHDPRAVARAGILLAGSLILFAALAAMMVAGWIRPFVAATLAGLWAWGAFIGVAIRDRKRRMQPDSTRSSDHERPAKNLLTDDRFLGGLLAALAVFMMFYYY